MEYVEFVVASTNRYCLTYINASVNVVGMLELYGTYASVQEAAQILGMTDGRIRQMLLAGRIPGAVKTGRDWLIPVVDGLINVVELNQVQTKDKNDV